MAEVKLDHVSKVYADNKKLSGKKAIDDISFTVLDREFMVIVGPSGCGKSTLLRMIAGLEEISDGTLSIDGNVMNERPPQERDIAMVFQNYALYPHMTVYDNMAFGLRLKKYNKKEIKERVMQTAKLLEIEEELYRKPKALSGGQRQRVAIGRAIIRRPKVFLFDEPLSNLDAKLRSQMRIELQKLHRELNATMIYVTHDQVEAMTLGTRIALLNKGKLMQLDTPLHLYNYPQNKFVAGFIGSPPMNFIRGIIQEETQYFFAPDAVNCRINLGPDLHLSLKSYLGKNLLTGIRPEHITICEENENCQPDCYLPVSAYENMGNEQLVYFSFGAQTLIVRRAPKDTLEFGKEKGICFDPGKLIYIDEATNQVVN